MADDRHPLDEDYIPIPHDSFDDDEDEALPPSRKNRHVLLYGWLIWIAFTVVMTAVLLPKVIYSIRQSGVIELIEEHRRMTTTAISSDLRTVYPYFVIPGAHDGTLSYQEYPVKQSRTGQGVYHDTMEALFAGPPADALSKGAITCIAPATNLRGLSESNGIIYVDLSGTFTESAGIWPGTGLDPAVQQIRRSLLAMDGVRDVIIMLDGEVTEL